MPERGQAAGKTAAEEAVRQGEIAKELTQSLSDLPKETSASAKGFVDRIKLVKLDVKRCHHL